LYFVPVSLLPWQEKLSVSLCVFVRIALHLGGYVRVSSAGKTANLEINKAQAGLMARGAFDP
jgi:hypothetical protein